MALLPPLLTPALWQQQGNVPALTRLLRAYLVAATNQLVVGRHLDTILGVFQRLILSKSNDHEGFALLSSICEFVPR